MSDDLSEFDGQLLDGLDFCARTYALFESVRAQEGGVERIRIRAGIVEKRLLEELLPICRYVQTYYRLGRYISVKWVNGSQSYDAELHQSGEYVRQGFTPPVTYLEATCAMHPNEHWIGKLLNAGKPAFAPEGISKEKGRNVKSEPIVFSGNEHILKFAPIVQSLIEKKSGIAYPEHTSLVVKCHLNTLYTPSDWQELTSTVERAVRSTPFKEVLLFDGVTERAVPLALQRS
jgi:hypothetical protein